MPREPVLAFLGTLALAMLDLHRNLLSRRFTLKGSHSRAEGILMPGKPDPSVPLEIGTASRFDRGALEAGWAAENPPDINRFLPASGPTRLPLLRELVQIDLERRLKNGEPARVEAYLKRFPELAAEPSPGREPGPRGVCPSPRPRSQPRPGRIPAPFRQRPRPLLLHLELEAHAQSLFRSEPPLRHPRAANGFYPPRRLIAAMQTWVFAKQRPLGDILVEQGAMSTERRTLLDALVQEHLRQHDNDPQQSLAAVSSLGSARQELQRIADPEVQGSLAQVSAARQGEEDLATRPSTMGEETSAGTRFRILRPHARGGLGKVFVAEDGELHREVALKEIQGRHADNPTSRARFVLEAEITGGLEHPGIVPVYGLGQYADGRPFYAMRFIRGDSLKEAIDRYHGTAATNSGERAVQFRKLLGRFLDVCNAIAYAHSRGVLHRDLKPSNVMLGKFGETLVVDWGLAKPGHGKEPDSTDEAPLRPSSQSGMVETVAGSTIGTPQFMSPEQAAGRIDLIGPASDVYSLGATLFCLLTGQAPVNGKDLGEVLEKVQKGAFPPPRQIKSNVPRTLEAICLQSMSLLPEDRYATPRALADDVEHWLADEPVLAFREPLHALGRWGRRHKTLVATAGMLLITTVIALTVSLILLDRKQAEIVRERNAANRAKDQAEAIDKFYEDHVLAAARPKGLQGGIGKDVTLKEALDQATPKIDTAFAGQPELEATVRKTLGMTYWYLGQYEAANPHLEKAYRIRLSQLGEDHPDTLACLHDLARQRWRQGKFDEGIALCRQALEKRKRVLGSEHPDTLELQLFLGLFLLEKNRFQLDQNQLDEAETILRNAIESCKRTLGPDHFHTLRGQNDLALVLSYKSKEQEALLLNRQTLEGRRRSLPPDHPATLLSMTNLADSLRATGQLEEAESLYRQCLGGRQRVLGNEHEDTWICLDKLSSMLISQRKLSEIEAIHRLTLKDCQRLRRPDDPETLIALTNLGAFLGAHDKLEEAAEHLWQAVEGSRRKLGLDHFSTLRRQNQFAWLLEKQGKTKEAEDLYQQTLEAQRRVRRPQARGHARYANQLASVALA